MLKVRVENEKRDPCFRFGVETHITHRVEITAIRQTS
jgi:hypothetical protein